MREISKGPISETVARMGGMALGCRTPEDRGPSAGMQVELPSPPPAPCIFSLGVPAMEMPGEIAFHIGGEDGDAGV